LSAAKHQVFLRYNYFRNEYPFNTAVGGKNALDAASDFRDRRARCWAPGFVDVLAHGP